MNCCRRPCPPIRITRADLKRYITVESFLNVKSSVIQSVVERLAHKSLNAYLVLVKSSGSSVRLHTDKSDNVTAEIKDMCDAILNDTALECDALEGSNTVAVGLAAVESASKGGEPILPAYIL